MEWLKSLFIRVRMLMEYGFGSFLKNLGTMWKWYLIVLVVILCCVVSNYYNKVKESKQYLKNATIHERRADSLREVTRVFEKEAIQHKIQIDKKENERHNDIYRIDTIAVDSLQSEIDKEFNFPKPRSRLR